MANFDRNFLVPYLENICTLHLLEQKVSAKYRNALYDKQKNDKLINFQHPIPKKTEAEEVASCGVLGALIFGIFSVILCLIGTIVAPKDANVDFLWFVIVGYILIFIFFPLYLMNNTRKHNEMELKKYNAKVQEINKKNELNYKKGKAKQKELEDNLLFWQTELNKIVDIRDDVYSVNIIPRHYRDIYTAVYLYDWFSTGMSTDLDHALSMFVLEEIKAKLDIIISKLDDVLINQSHIISNQERAIAQQEADNKRLMNKLNDMQATEEERNCYLNMIESNTRATAYFAAADYVRKL